MRFLRHVTDIIMVTRPVLVIPVWGFCALGFQRALHLQQRTSLFFTDSLNPYILIVLFSLSVASVYILNQIADIEVDKDNGGMPLIANGIISLRTSWCAAIIFALIPIVTSVVIKVYPVTIASVATIILGYVYSFRPLRFSGRPIADFISNATGYGIIAFGVGWVCGGMPIVSREFIRSALPYFFLMCAGSISSTLPDYEGDRKDGKNTTAVIFGIRVAHLFAMAALGVALLWALLGNDAIAVICAGASFPFYAGYQFKRSTFFMEASYKIGGGLCMLAAFSAMPLFLVPSFIVFIATWLYFRIRHGINYPSLVPVNKDQ